MLLNRHLRQLFLMLCFVAGLMAAQSSQAIARNGVKKADDVEPVPGYKYREIDGFHLLVNNAVLEHNEKSTRKRKPMEALELELDMIQNELPPRAVNVLRTIPIWVEWHTGEPKAVAVYRPGNKVGKRVRFDSIEHAVKSNCVEICKMDSLTEEHQGDNHLHRCVLLHEFTHAVHHHLFDYDNPVIKAAYAEAMSKGLYEGHYAATNHKEYFAEVSCAYFGHLHYPPHDREALKKYDPAGYRMMELTWGTPEQIEQALKPEREKAAMRKFNMARNMLRNKATKSDAIVMLNELVRNQPNTRAAREAKKLLDKESREKPHASGS